MFSPGNRTWSTVSVASQCFSPCWSSWPPWPLISRAATLQLHQISSRQMWAHQPMATGSFFHLTELQVCPTTVRVIKRPCCMMSRKLISRLFQRRAWRRIWWPLSFWCWSTFCRDIQSTRRICYTLTVWEPWESSCKRFLHENCFTQVERTEKRLIKHIIIGSWIKLKCSSSTSDQWWQAAGSVLAAAIAALMKPAGKEKIAPKQQD